MKQIDDSHIEVNGKTYWHDPDFDCYRRVEEIHEPSKYAWMVVVAAVAAVAFVVEYLHK